MNIPARINRYTQSLRFPVLLVLTGVIFVVDLFVPDIIPFIDEIILGLVVALLARMRKPKAKSLKSKESTDSLTEKDTSKR